jgi:alpha-galactosidase
MLAAPLMMGCDVRNMDDATKTILLNKDIIAIDQDPLGKQGFRVYRKDGIEAFRKPLSGNREAVAILNRNSTEGKITLSYNDLELNQEEKYTVYDAWKHENVQQQAGTVSSVMSSHECQVYILTPEKR